MTIGQKTVPLPLFHVDAFADRPFSGNPAAVVLLDGPREDDWLRGVAAEMNLSETAFLLADGNRFRLRWFTPKVEVALCGHATLASAFVLWEEGRKRADEKIEFETASSVLIACRQGNEIELDFPTCPAVARDVPAGLLESLGIQNPPAFVGQNGMDYLVALDSESQVRALCPDFPKLATVPARGVIVTSPSAAPEFDFVSRFFAPAAGVNEDPVTGSAHCCLGPFWGERLGKTNLVGFQASARGGRVTTRIAASRVFLSGQARLVAKGTLLV